jgi:peroxiredoxin
LLPNVDSANGKVVLEWPGSRTTLRLVADEKTAFVYREISQSPGGWGQVKWQTLPREVADDAVIPGVHVRADFQEGRLSRAQVFVIEDVELGPPSREAFVMSVPAGTNVIDYRGGDGQRPNKLAVVREPLTDVVKKANELSPNPAVEPVLTAGQPAPPLQPQTWLDQSGAIAPPDLSGKVVLVNFWATSCGPCIGELPEIGQAARYFAKCNVAVIGLHADGADATELAEFARRKEITWPLAIDKPAAERFFGAGFQAYGVHAIPSFAVIDRDGRFVYCGDLRTALEHVRRLVE